MTTRFPNGAIFTTSVIDMTGVGITAVSNANPAVATVAAGAAVPAKGDIVLLTIGGWPDLDGRPVRVGAVTAGADGAGGTFELEGVDTTDTSNFPAALSSGSYGAVSNEVAMNQVTAVATSGGDPNYYTFQFLEDKSNRQRQKPTYVSALSLTLTMACDMDLPWYDALKARAKSGNPVILKETLPNGDILLMLAFLSFSGFPTQALNENMAVTCPFAINSDMIRYPAAAA